MQATTANENLSKKLSSAQASACYGKNALLLK